VKRFIAFVMAKTGKWLLSLPLLVNRVQPLARKILYRLLRTHDYERASPMMRKTMVQVAAEDLRPILPLVTVPTDIFWGHDDRLTPFSDAKLVLDGIRGSRLHAYAGVRHGVHKDRAREIAGVITGVISDYSRR
jgi:pimeloyl-ACP methyl ester carboxylesterase